MVDKSYLSKAYVVTTYLEVLNHVLIFYYLCYVLKLCDYTQNTRNEFYKHRHNQQAFLSMVNHIQDICNGFPFPCLHYNIDDKKS